MKKAGLYFLIITFVLTTSISPLQAVEIEDVPEDHWAYESVNKLVERGYMSLYDDDTFAGANRVSRFELAEILANMLEDLEEGMLEMEEDDIDLLRELSVEFRDELVEIAGEMDLFQERIEELEEEKIIQGEDLAEMYENMSDIEREVNEIIDEIAELRIREERVEELENRLMELEDDMDVSQERLTELDEKIDEEDPERLEDIEMFDDRLDNLEERLSAIETQHEENQEDIRELERQRSNHLLYIGAVGLLSMISLLQN